MSQFRDSWEAWGPRRLRDWLSEDHPVHFMLDVGAQLDLEEVEEELRRRQTRLQKIRQAVMVLGDVATRFTLDIAHRGKGYL